MPTLINLSVVPANPGFKIVGVDDGSDSGILELHGDVIAWRIETWRGDDGAFLSKTQPLTVDGLMHLHDVGIACPDGSVHTSGGISDSLEAAQCSNWKRIGDRLGDMPE